ncbi:unnamed protein product [Protopolystoma xenopodis]|uniref:Uncharacterized protein n=1 Tax=Protopolystoma xenopodis TaxID=117903 RepID=A0A3S5CRS5_9PLAT|nr:unnamed protein product [Protopolystoma xenopodis]
MPTTGVSRPAEIGKSIRSELMETGPGYRCAASIVCPRLRDMYRNRRVCGHKRRLKFPIFPQILFASDDFGSNCRMNVKLTMWPRRQDAVKIPSFGSRVKYSLRCPSK